MKAGVENQLPKMNVDDGRVRLLISNLPDERVCGLRRSYAFAVPFAPKLESWVGSLKFSYSRTQVAMDGAHKCGG